MSTTVTQPKSPPAGGNPTTHALVSLMQDPRQFRAWLGVTPNWLRTAIAAIALLSALFALAIRHAALEQSETIKTIQEDSSPSIFAGQRLRASLADMHSNLANELLESGSGERTVEEEYTPEVKTGPTSAAHGDLVNELLAAPANPKQAVDLQDSAPTIFRKRRAEAARYLLAAAMNITYPGEVWAVRTVISELPRYEECAARARLLHDQHDPRFLDAHQEADAIMQTKMLPAIDRLIAVNQRELDEAYQSDRTAAKVSWMLVFVTGAVLLGAIAGLKFLLFKHMRRFVNPPLLAAAVLAAAGCLWALIALWESAANIKVGKQDAFDSIAALEAARAIAYDANGDESRWLLLKMNTGQPAQIQSYADSFQKKAKAIAEYPGTPNDVQLRAEIDRTQKAPAGLKGYLADELNNITFSGELSAAEQALQTFLDYLKIDQRIRALKDLQQARDLCLGTKYGQSDWAFDQFDQALGKTIKINRDWFDSSLKDGAGWLAGLDWLLPLGLALAVSLLTFLGLRPRLREYDV